MDQAAEVWPMVERLAARAAAEEARLVVFPEVTYPAYWLESARRYRAADIERTAAVIERFGELARRYGLWVVAGIVEEEQSRARQQAVGAAARGPLPDGRGSDRLYNAAAVIDRRGNLVGVARKNFLWDCDNRWFSAGERISTFDTEFGRMGVLICADGRCPEISATLAHQGATFAVMPTAWVNAAAWTGEFRNPQADFLIRARAIEFGIPYVCCSKAGREGRNMEYVGQSQIVAADGQVLARAPIEGEALVAADIVPGTPRAAVLDEQTRDRLLETHSPPPSQARAPIVHVPAAGGVNPLIEAIRGAGGRAALMSRAGLRSFVPARLDALAGAQAIVCDVQQPDDNELNGLAESEVLLARARAAENRVYVLAADERVRLAVDPSGRILFQDGDAATTIMCDLSKADDKRVTPETHIWEQRRVECYEL